MTNEWNDFFESQEIASIEWINGFTPLEIEETQDWIKWKLLKIQRVVIANRLKRDTNKEWYKEISEAVLDIINNWKSFTLKQLNDMFWLIYMSGMSNYDYMENLVAWWAISATWWKADRVYVQSKI